MARLSKEEFVEILKKLRICHDLVSDMDKLIQLCKKEINVSAIGDFCYGISSDEEVVFLLDKLMGSENNDVDYWVFQLNYGRDYYEGCVEWNGEAVDISTAEKLYDYMVKRYEV